MPHKTYGWAMAPAICIVLGIAAGSFGSAQAAGIRWEKQGPFQACLDAKAQAWIGAKVELVVNEDPKMGAIDDKMVAEWAAGALKDCAAKAAGADAVSEQQFMKYMAHWRDHIYAAADEIRRRNRPD